jgi:hypothetical protein
VQCAILIAGRHILSCPWALQLPWKHYNAEACILQKCRARFLLQSTVNLFQKIMFRSDDLKILNRPYIF